MPDHIITTVVPEELAPALSTVAAAGLRAGLITCEVAGFIMAAANVISAAADKVPPGSVSFYEVPAYWRPGSIPGDDIPCVILSLGEFIRREVAIATGGMSNRIGLTEKNRCLCSYCRDWMRYSLHDGMTDPVFRV